MWATCLWRFLSGDVLNPFIFRGLGIIPVLLWSFFHSKCLQIKYLWIAKKPEWLKIPFFFSTIFCAEGKTSVFWAKFHQNVRLPLRETGKFTTIPPRRVVLFLKNV